VNGISVGNNSYTVSIAKQELMLSTYNYPLIENITLDEQLKIKNNSFYDILSKGMEGIVDFEPGVIINEKDKTERSLPEVSWSLFGKKTSLTYALQDLTYDPFTNTYYEFKPDVDASNNVTFSELKREGIAKELQGFPTVSGVSGLKSQYYYPNLNYTINETAGKVYFTGGVFLKGKDVDKHNYLRNQYITTFDLEGNKTNEVALKFDYPRKLYYATKVDNGSLFLYGRAIVIGNKNNDPDKDNFWEVLIDEDGNEVFKHKLKATGGQGLFNPIAGFSKDSKLMVLSQNGGLVLDVMSIDKIGLAQSVGTQYQEISKQGDDGNEYRLHDKVVVNTLISTSGDAFVYGYYKKEIQKAGVDPSTKQPIEQIIEYPAVFAYQIGKDLKIKAHYIKKITNEKNQLPDVLMIDGGNGKIAWFTNYIASGSSSSARTRLMPFGIKEYDGSDVNKSRNYMLGCIDVVNQSVTFKAGAPSNYELSGKMPYFLSANAEFFVIGNTKSLTSGVHQVIIEKFTL
ncbi:MAG: hypothetical protein AAGA66_12215, partial [Bacteroidota bacterium]